MTQQVKRKSFFVFLPVLLWMTMVSAFANVPGGGTGTGPNVTVTQTGTNVVLSNGIVSFTINTANANITNFTYNGANLLSGGHGGGYFYFDGSGGPTFNNPTYTLAVNPANNGGNQAEVWLQQTGSPMDAAAYFDLNRGQQGFYDTLILTHETGYPDYPGAELRSNVYVGSIFNWLAVDPYRFRQMASPNDTVVAVAGAPKEVMQWTSGIYNGLTECKYAYSDPLGELNVWGWASTTATAPYGIWQTLPSHEFEDGGPMHRELTEHIGNTLLNMFGGGHYGFGSSGDQPAGSFSSKTFGPAFVYANQYAGAASDPVSLKAQVLWADAQAQAAAEQSAWPYTWFNPQPVAGMTGSAYPQTSGRSTVSGTFAINDTFNPGASPVSMWIGLAPVDGGIDFQQQYLTCQFWAKTGTGGSFTIPNVLPGTYNLWAFGPGAAGTFEKANVTVAAGQALSLGTVTWTPPRQGSTVWEIGYPNRNSNKFNNGEHNVTPYSGVLPGYAGGAPFDVPTDWGAFMDYTGQYPAGVSYVVGTSNYASDWDYLQPTVPNGTGFAGSTSKIYFNLASAPTAAQTARLYIAFAAVNSGACILTINGTVQTTSVMGSTDGNYATIANATTGFVPPNHSFDTPLRLGSNGAWGDAYLNFPGTSLKAGLNEIDIAMRPTGGASLGQGFEYDYLRLELTGYTSSPTVTPTKTNTPLASTMTFTSTLTKTNTPVPPTSTFTSTFTNTLTNSPTNTLTFTNSSTKTNSPTSTLTSSFTFTPTNSPVPPTSTFTSPFTSTFTSTATQTATPSSTSTPTFTNSPVPPTSTFTNTPVPPTNTNTPVLPTDTNTPVPPSSTPTFTNSPIPPTQTGTSSPTPVPPTATNTNSPVPPTSTNTSAPTSTNTPLPPTSTNTPVAPTSTTTFTNTPIPPTATNTPVPPTLTFTHTPVPPTSTFTNTPVPPTSTFTRTMTPSFTTTFTPVPPTSTFTNTPVPPTATFTFTASRTPTPTLTLTPTSTFTSTATPTAVPTSSSFVVQLLSGVTNDGTNSPHPQIQIVNTGTGPLNLNNVQVKYWFNCDCTNQTIQAWVDWAGLMPTGTTVSGNVQVSVQPTSLGGQTNYVLYTFTGNMVLQPGQSIQIQSRFNKSDWTNMIQSNDWSFASYASFTNWTHVTGYQNGSLVWGQEPVATTSALNVVSAMVFPNPSTGNGISLTFNLAGGSSAQTASPTGSSPILVDPNAKVTLKIYTAAFRLIWSQTLTGPSYGTTGEHVVAWDEKDGSGSAVANGVYLIRVTVDSHGQNSAALAKILILK